LANLRKAYELDPRNGSKIDGLSRTLFYMHRVDESWRINEIAMTWDSTSERTLIWRMFLSLILSEDSNLIYDAINRFEQNASPASAGYWMEKIDVIKRDYKSALGRRGGVGEYMISDSTGYYGTKGAIHLYLGDSALSRVYYDSSRKVSEGRMANNPDNYNYRLSLANAYAHLGRRAEAIALGEKAAEMMPVSKDALEGSGVLTSLAGIYIITGDHDKAIDLLDSLLTIPSTIQVRAIRLYPIYDPLWDYPRFQEMIDKYEKKYGS
jgi:tetratricopeptide (TPR) repeat protein